MAFEFIVDTILEPVISSVTSSIFGSGTDEDDEFDDDDGDWPRGWNLQWIFPGDFEYEFIPLLISEGLDHLRLAHEYVGMFGSDVRA